jgi:hypothetical protein
VLGMVGRSWIRSAWLGYPLVFLLGFFGGGKKMYDIS